MAAITNIYRCIFENARTAIYRKPVMTVKDSSIRWLVLFIKTYEKSQNVEMHFFPKILKAFYIISRLKP